MKEVYKRPKYLKDVPNHYCPGCGHSTVHRLMTELFDEMGIGERTVGVAPAGCAVLAYFYMDVDICESAHGRGTAVATGIKRVLPDHVVFSYQGDGDLAAIGTAETIHSANRGENITVIFINNAIYGMTGGQMAPTSYVGMKTTTSPYGRSPEVEGHPLKITNLMKEIAGATYVERVAVNSPKGIIKTKKAIKTAFEVQMAGQGFSIIEVLSPCPTNWRVTPLGSWKFIDEILIPEFPLGVIVDRRPKAKKGE
jgi:2-oxoglutarate/2-oxoacid ferredoxin oxidoreductase subunit beta